MKGTTAWFRVLRISLGHIWQPFQVQVQADKPHDTTFRKRRNKRDLEECNYRHLPQIRPPTKTHQKKKNPPAWLTCQDNRYAHNTIRFFPRPGWRVVVGTTAQPHHPPILRHELRSLGELIGQRPLPTAYGLPMLPTSRFHCCRQKNEFVSGLIMVWPRGWAGRR